MIDKNNLKRALKRVGIKNVKFLLTREDEAIVLLSENTFNQVKIVYPKTCKKISAILDFTDKDQAWLDSLLAEYKEHLTLKEMVQQAEKMSDWLKKKHIQDGNTKSRYRTFLRKEVRWRKERQQNGGEKNLDPELLRKLND